MFQTFIMINKIFMFKLFLSGSKFGFANNTHVYGPAFLQIAQYITLLLEVSHKGCNFQTLQNLRFTALEPELSSLFWLILQSMLHQTVDLTGLFLLQKLCMQVQFFAHLGHLQALKVCDSKLLCLIQLCGLKDWIIKVGIYIEKYHQLGNRNYPEMSGYQYRIFTPIL